MKKNKTKKQKRNKGKSLNKNITKTTHHAPNKDKANILYTMGSIYFSEKNYRIHYLVPHTEEGDDYTPFQSATPGLIQTLDMLTWANIQFADIRELNLSWKKIATLRARGLISHQILPVRASALHKLTLEGDLAKIPFLIILSNLTTLSAATAALSHLEEGSYLHVSSQRGEGRIYIEDFKETHLLGYILNRITLLERSGFDGQFLATCRQAIKGNLPKRSRSSLPETGHNLTRPNELALRALGLELSENVESPTPGNDANALSWIARSHREVENYRLQLMGKIISSAKNILTLCSPALIPKTNTSTYLSNAIKEGISPTMKKIVWSFLNTETIIPQLEVDNPEIFNDDFLMSFISIRRMEQMLQTLVIVRISSGSLTPSIRLKPLSRKYWEPINNLAACARAGRGPHIRHKLRRLKNNVQEKIEESLDPVTLEVLKKSVARVEGIKLFSEHPLEWLRINDIPLMLIHECSRIPMLPLSLSYAVASNQNPLSVTPNFLTDILIIRSFSKDDRIAKFLETAIKANEDLYSNTEWKVKIRIEDVNTPSELVKALTSHKGAIVIFDCHGHFDTQQSTASLIIGGSPVYLWELRHKIPIMPPIVMLSACDTLPIEGAHNAAAISMLFLGAKTVLATLLPIDATHASAFLARTIYRIGDFVPVALRFRKEINWREVMSGMIKMAHITEIFQDLEQRKIISREQHTELHTFANIDINNLRPDWLERVSVRMAEKAALSRDLARKLIITEAPLTVAMMQVQLGNPEQIRLLEHNPGQQSS